MVRKILSLFLLLAVVVGCSRGAAEPDSSAAAAPPASAPASVLTPVKDKTADDVIAAYVAARGGKEKLAAIQSVRMVGILSGGGMKGLPTTVEKKRPNKFRRVLEDPEGRGVNAVDGDNAWQVGGPAGPNPAKVPPKSALRFKRASDIDGALVDYKAKGHQVELLGKEKLGDSEAYKLRVKFKDGEEGLFWIDAQSNLLVKSAEPAPTPMGIRQVEVRYRDYKAVNGVSFPYTEIVSIPDSNFAQTVAWHDIQVNVPVDDASFKMPG